jgi:tetratricopeptide (TPR) repeat protein
VKSFSQAGQLERMITLVDRALQNASRQEELRILKGELYLRKKDIEQAFPEFVLAIQELLQRGEQLRAISLLRRITKQHPGFHPALELLVDLYMQYGQESNLPGAFAMLADAYIARSLYPDAKKCLEKLVELEPRSRLHREKLDFVMSFLEIPEAERESIQRASEDFEIEISVDDTGPNGFSLDQPETPPPPSASVELTKDDT